MTLFLNERSVASLITMDDALKAIEGVFLESGGGGVVNVPRIRAPLKNGILRITAAVLTRRGYYGVKVSSTTVFGRNAGRLFCLYKEEGGELVAVVQVFGLGALRTGAASGVATKYMARADARILAVIGTGRQAKTQVAAIGRVRPIEEVRVYGRNAERAEEFRRELTASLGLNVRTATAPREAVEGAHMIVTATTSTTPVVEGRWLAPGVHVNAIGANYESRRELDSETVARAAIVATDDLEQVRYESTDLAEPVKEGLLTWDQVVSLGDIVSGAVPGRRSDTDVTLFKSLGVAIEDVALATKAYEKAIEQGIGQILPDLAG